MVVRGEGKYESPLFPNLLVWVCFLLHFYSSTTLYCVHTASKMTEEKPAPAAMDVDRDVVKKVDPTLEKHAHDADEAMKVFEELQGESITLDEETNKRLLRIIDWHMMPIMCFVYGLNYLDSGCFHLHLCRLLIALSRG